MSTLKENEKNDIDYLIVGGGSAGCVLASKLSESHKVCLVEAGPQGESMRIDMPAALMYNLRDKKFNWYYHTAPQKAMNDRILYWPRGRVLGGSSAINAMVYIRGHPMDYNRWVKEGATGWSYKECLPYFIDAENFSEGGDNYRGNSGPLVVKRGDGKNPLYDAFLKAATQAGYPLSNDLNGLQQEGFGRMDMTIKNGVRCSSKAAYLAQNLSEKKNLRILTNSQVSEILIENKRAVGVKINKSKLMAKEIILCGGAINSPQLLMLSGVGDSEQLKKVGIESKIHLPGVGQNLQDHMGFHVQYRCKKPITLHDVQRFGYSMIKAGFQWIMNKNGACASSHLEAGGFIRSKVGVEHPDVQFHFFPSSVYDHGRKASEFHAYLAHVGIVRPTSRGYIALQSSDPLKPPLIQPNYLSTKEDIEDMRNAVKLTREIFKQSAFDEFNGGEFMPGAKIESDEQIDEFIRRKAETAYHPCGTCKMGTDSDSVVDPLTMRVHGMEGLRIVDASVMPSLVSGNINAPIIMMAEKAADMILNKPKKIKNEPVRVFDTETQRGDKFTDLNLE